MGARDSKLLSPEKRAALEAPIKAHAKGFALIVLEPADLDREVPRHRLNEAEGRAFARAAAAAAREAGASSLGILQADAADAVEANFQAMIARALAATAPRLRVGRWEVEHKGDTKFPAVSAASILAKVERDRRIEAIAAELGQEIGSGYPADPATERFLRDYIRANKDLPPFARRSWKTSRKMLKEAGIPQRPLDDFSDEEDTP